ncbi:MAG: tripartite tricarboxylate transporter substrate binding protein [Betaproteobacteria bacterium]|nr:tripartite tricarboxylate transporter substrate binding protein [Betaproteobacteria bacterium]
MKTLHFSLHFWLGLLLMASAVCALAQQGYPSRPVRFVVPFAPGGSTDFMARAMGQKLAERLGQAFVIENRAGAGGAVGTALVAKSTPDGYTVLLGHVSPMAINPNLEKVPYNPVLDFTAASLLSTSHFVLVVHPSLPVKSVNELIALARTRPGEINYASSGRGTNLFLISELFKSRAKINLVHIPYKGTGPAVIAMLAGEAQTMFGSVTGVITHVRTGRLRALAMTSPKRSSLLPEVPTLTEAGLSGIDVGSWTALVAPAGTPREIIARLNAEIYQISAMPDYRQQLDKQAIEPLTSSPEQYIAFVKAELEKWGKVIRASQVKSD